MQIIYVIIVNYKSHLVITDAIKSIHEDSLDIKIIIMDNENSNDSRLALKNINDERVEIVFMEENIGFVSACNKAYLYITEKYNDVNYIFLLNPDAIIKSNLIANLYKNFSDCNVAAASPKIVDFDGNISYEGLIVDYDKCSIDALENHTQNTLTYEVDVFHGCAVLLDANKFYEVGMFMEEIFMYYDEAFLSMKLKKRSYKIVYCAEYSIKHRLSYSTRSSGLYKSYYHARNHIYFFSKYGKKTVFCKYKGVLIDFLSSIKHFNFSKTIGIAYGIFHSKINRYGKL